VETPSFPEFFAQPLAALPDAELPFWGRTALNHRAGAYGFSRSIADVMALVHAGPHSRANTFCAPPHGNSLRAMSSIGAPDSGVGVRTRISDDLLWLPFVTAHYVRTTGDAAILDEIVPFSEANRSNRSNGKRFHSGAFSQQSVVAGALPPRHRALGHRRPHGLPLIGAGDWNDGLNRVESAGKARASG